MTRVRMVYSNHSRLESAVRVPPELGKPVEGRHLTSTPLDNLAELAGKACYDSLSNPKSRDSVEYHKHIIDVGHLSVYEHASLVFDVGNMFLRLPEATTVLLTFIGRPGVQVGHDYQRFLINLRAVREWSKWRESLNTGPIYMRRTIGECLSTQAETFAPLTCAELDTACIDWDDWMRVVPPDEGSPQEIYASLFFTGVSRGMTHELVRHRLCAFSQRSTRYCDEEDSPWIPHPKIRNEPELMRHFDYVKYMARNAYVSVRDTLVSKMTASGVDKLTARKQARGAARGILGNALETEILVTATIAQWQRMIKQRANPAADDEIHEVFDEVRSVLQESLPEFKEFLS